MATETKKSAKSFFKNNPFFSVKEEETVETPASAPQPPFTGTYTNPVAQPFVGNAAVPQSNFPMPPPVVNVSAEVEEQYLNHFMEFLEKNNIPGLDYLEFANLLHKQFEKFGNTLSEAQLYEMAFMSFETQGITKQRLIETANIYLKMTADHKKEFDQYLSNDGAKTVQDKTNENARLIKANSDAAVQIDNLQKQIMQIQGAVNTNTQTINANNAIIQGEQQKLQAKQVKFEAAYKLVIEKITGDTQKIQTLLK